MSLLAYTWVAGVATGGFAGVLLGQWLTWLTLRNPLNCVFRAYSELFADIEHLCATGQLPAGKVKNCPSNQVAKREVYGATWGAPHQAGHQRQVVARTLPLRVGQLVPPQQPADQLGRQRGPRDVEQRRQA